MKLSDLKQSFRTCKIQVRVQLFIVRYFLLFIVLLVSALQARLRGLFNVYPFYYMLIFWIRLPNSSPTSDFYETYTIHIQLKIRNVEGFFVETLPTGNSEKINGKSSVSDPGPILMNFCRYVQAISTNVRKRLVFEISNL